jgi:hypothetical protein
MCDPRLNDALPLALYPLYLVYIFALSIYLLLYTLLNVILN